MIRPSLSIATRCAMVRALAMSWVMVTAVIPRSRTRLTIRLLIEWARIGSSPVVGSSKNRISGWPAMARASATRFCMPPESSDGRRSSTSDEPDLFDIFQRDAPHLRRMDAAALAEREGDVAPHRQRNEQRAARKQHAEPAAHPLKLAPAHAGHVLAVHQYAAFIHLHQAQDALQHHRLDRKSTRLNSSH